ncbi:hypothetical protein D5086_012675 [Populus alba]|uniref:Uncharacterized protein n=1 Tax=Populus alba TaxID=43335 RepID=A0ACC4C3D1_POPAL
MNARNPILMAAAEESVNMLSAPSLILFVKRTAEDTDRSAKICNLTTQEPKHLTTLSCSSQIRILQIEKLLHWSDRFYKRMNGGPTIHVQTIE